jgi:transposase-like protein
MSEAREANPDDSWNGIYTRIGKNLGIHPTTLRAWLRSATGPEADNGTVTALESREIKELKRKVKELERANEILLAASSFFARELDPRLPF